MKHPHKPRKPRRRAYRPEQGVLARYDEVTEKQFQNTVQQLAQLKGWSYYHTHDSRRSQPGYPDLTLWHTTQGRIIFAELKTMKGRLTQDQRRVLNELRLTGVAEVYVWRPNQLADDIPETLVHNRAHKDFPDEWWNDTIHH